jgi:hypothetical protein
VLNNERLLRKINVFDPQIEELAAPQTGSPGECQNRPIPNTNPSRWTCAGERFDLRLC